MLRLRRLLCRQCNELWWHGLFPKDLFTMKNNCNRVLSPEALPRRSNPKRTCPLALDDRDRICPPEEFLWNARTDFATGRSTDGSIFNSALRFAWLRVSPLSSMTNIPPWYMIRRCMPVTWWSHTRTQGHHQRRKHGHISNYNVSNCMSPTWIEMLRGFNTAHFKCQSCFSRFNQSAKDVSTEHVAMVLSFNVTQVT